MKLLVKLVTTIWMCRLIVDLTQTHLGVKRVKQRNRQSAAALMKLIAKPAVAEWMCRLIVVTTQRHLGVKNVLMFRVVTDTTARCDQAVGSAAGDTMTTGKSPTHQVQTISSTCRVVGITTACCDQAVGSAAGDTITTGKSPTHQVQTISSPCRVVSITTARCDQAVGSAAGDAICTGKSPTHQPQTISMFARPILLCAAEMTVAQGARFTLTTSTGGNSPCDIMAMNVHIPILSDGAIILAMNVGQTGETVPGVKQRNFRQLWIATSVPLN